MGVVAAISAVASTGYSIYQGEQQKKQQKKQCQTDGSIPAIWQLPIQMGT